MKPFLDRLSKVSHPRAWALSLVGASLIACSQESGRVSRVATNDATPFASSTGPIDPRHMLDLERYLNESYVAMHGACLESDSRPDRSRLLYVMMPEDTAYIRLTVVSPANGGEIELIDLVRGLPDGGQWAATQLQPNAPAVTRLYKTISDHAPVVSSLTADNIPELRSVAAAALKLPCANS